MEPLFFDDWQGLARIGLVGTGAYVALVAMVRLSGKRTLGKMNAFDLVVTVALGSTLATALLDASVPLLEGIAALALLVVLQYAITWTSVRLSWVRRLVKSEPSLLVRDGGYLDDRLQHQRVTREEIQAALRQNGHADLSQITAIVLETDGSLSILPRSGHAEAQGRTDPSD